MNYKLFSAAIICLCLFISCNPGIDHVQDYIVHKIGTMNRFNVTVLSIEKIGGQKFSNVKTGEDMYALEFIASVKSTQNGFVFMDEDGTVRNFHFFDIEPKEALQRSYLKIKEIRHINVGDQFQIHSKVILKKLDAQWQPIALRWDLY